MKVIKKNKNTGNKLILIVGKVPPPIGGVTIHVQRLLLKLSKQDDIKYIFKKLTKINLLFLLFQLHNYGKVHVHSSNPLLRLLITIYGKISFCKTIITFHGDIGRFDSSFLNYIDILTLKFSDYPIVLNDTSYKIANGYNKNAKKISSFISPILENEFLDINTEEKIINIKDKTKTLFCTNAYNLTFDKNNSEIYGIDEVINFFVSNKTYGLILSDPSGAYYNKFKKENILLPINILIINTSHSFYKVLSLCDVNIRNTSTDGDSISVKESLYLDKITMCTDVVSRPAGVFLYKRGEFGKAVLKISNFDKSNLFNQSLEGTINLFELYRY